jgi:type 1 glutamine amidotransferase
MKFKNTLCAALLPLLSVSGFLAPSDAMASSDIDCPLRDAPFSLESPLIDIMLSESASAVLNRHMNDVLTKIPSHFASTTPPSFSAILDARKIAAMAGVDAAILPQIEQELATIPVTDADRSARCARYDTEVPQLPVADGKPRLLLFEKINGFKDTPSFNAAHELLQQMASKQGWALVTTDNGAVFNTQQLSQFDAVIWNNISGDVLTLSQRQAFRTYIEQGGGFVGIHGSGGDPTYFWDWYVDELIGARFIGHPKDPQYQDAKIVVENNQEGTGKGLPAEWLMNEEWYSFDSSPRNKGATVIATLDESTYNPVGHHGTDLGMGDHPIAWQRCIEQGRSFYSAIGHRPEVYEDLHHQRLLLQGIAWAANKTKDSCSTPATTLNKSQGESR